MIEALPDDKEEEEEEIGFDPRWLALSKPTVLSEERADRDVGTSSRDASVRNCDKHISKFVSLSARAQNERMSSYWGDSINLNSEDYAITVVAGFDAW